MGGLKLSNRRKTCVVPICSP